MHPPFLRSTRLDQIRMDPDGARFSLDGRPVHLSPDREPATLAALRAFYDGALQEAGAEAARAEKSGLFARFRSWLGRLFAPPAPASPSLPAPAAVLPAQPVAPAAPARSPSPGPQLNAVFGDPQGIHVQWSLPAGRHGERTVDRRYPLESELGKRLQDCYGHLAQLGYQIVGLNLQPIPAPGGTKEGPAPAAEKPTPANASLRVAPEAEVKKAPEARSPTWVVRLLPESPEQPGRALTAPFASAENIQPLAGSDRLIRALRTAADPAGPAGEGLTCLRCTLAKTGLKVVAIGLGETKTGEPARWEEVSQWLERQPEANAEEKKIRAVPAPRAAGPELELNI